ncbi:MDR family MFS transporter [Corallococcus terminator]|uniref:DHA2 family efflux MFS transporter permease subunit n=1 Tax=Corallococcus terminator TaxID=2316733 RepID=A0A3A8JNU8_9BACT|nr:MDR family MFS transporter [Corallococcus terminator]RKG92111.1 DHA2 family efflux MFS transporter permease subunit [Corallococcus terminator]
MPDTVADTAAGPRADAAPASERFSRSQKAFTLAGALLGLMLAALDQTIVATAGPAIQADLRIAPEHYPWLTTAYLVASTMMVPVWGKLSDLLGRRAVLIAGIAVFLTGSFLCGAARTTLVLILCRAVQGLGSAALFTGSLAVVADLFPPRDRGKYQGLFGAVFGLSSVIGPLAGGFITDALGWHWVFFINLPVGALALALILLRMPPLKPEGLHGGKLDVVGAVALALAVVPLLLALSLGHGASAPRAGGFAWSSAPILGLFALSAVAGALFIWRERRAKEPLLDPSLFRLRAFTAGNAAVFTIGAVFLASVTFLPLFMVNVVGLSATHSGLTLTPLTLGVVAGNVLSGQLVSRMGRYKTLMVGSLLFLMGGFAVMAFTLTPDSSQAEVTVKMVLVGLGLGPSIPLYTVAVQNAVPPQRIGVATSATTFFRQLGMTVGVALLGTVFAGTLGRELTTRTEQATQGLPQDVRQELQASSPNGLGHALGGEGAPAGSRFQPEEVKAKLRQGFAEERRQASQSLHGTDEARAHAKLDANEARALSTVDRVERALKESFTRATMAVYRFAIFVALAALLVTLLLPEMPLRRGAPRQAVAE